MKGNIKELGTYLENINKYSLIMFYGPNGYSIEENYKKTFDNLKGKNDEPFERALRRFKKKWEKAGVLREVRARSFYLKPSEQKKIARSKKRRR